MLVECVFCSRLDLFLGLENSLMAFTEDASLGRQLVFQHSGPLAQITCSRQLSLVQHRQVAQKPLDLCVSYC